MKPSSTRSIRLSNQADWDSANSEGKPIRYHLIPSPLGTVLVGLRESALCFVHFGDSEEHLVALLRARYPDTMVARATNQHTSLTTKVRIALHHLIDGEEPTQQIPIHAVGTSFQQKVWAYLRTIPAGEVRTYQEVAHSIGQPRAVRAVASVCARNDIALFVPCHRIIRSDGALGGFRWGVDRKRALLNSEQRARYARKTTKALRSRETKQTQPD